MSTEDNKAHVRRGWEVLLNQKNVAAIDELAVPDFTFHSGAQIIHGREAFKQFMTLFLTAFPDLHLTIEDLIGEGDCVSVRFTYRATHLGEFMGRPPTGKQVTATGLGFQRLANGKSLEEWVNQDYLE